VDARGRERDRAGRAVPTTAGTGSEVGRAAVVTNEKTHTKKIIFHPKMLPVQTICDPELTGRHAAGHHRRTAWMRSRTASKHCACRPITPSRRASRRMRAAGEGKFVTAYRDGSNIERAPT